MWQGCTKWKAVSFIQNLLYQRDFIHTCHTKSLKPKTFHSFLPYKISQNNYGIFHSFLFYKISRIKESKTSCHYQLTTPPSTPFFANPSFTPGKSDYILDLRLWSLLTVKYKDVSPTSWPRLPNLLQVRVPHVVYREQEYVLVFITACLDLKMSKKKCAVLCLQNCLDTASL